MADFKIVFAFSAEAQGWSEVYYRNAGNLQAAATFPDGFFQGRLQILDQTVTLKSARISDPLNLRSSLVVPLNLPGRAQSGLFRQPGGPEPSSMAAITTLSSTAVPSSRRLWLRGLADSLVVRDPLSGADDPPPALVISILNWIQALANNGFEIRSYVRVNLLTNFYQPITTIAPATVGTPPVVVPGQVTLTYTGILLPGLGSNALISQLSPKEFPGLNGLFKVLAVGLNSFTVQWNPPFAGPQPVTKGRWRPAVYQYGVIDPAVSGFLRYNSRATGRGFTFTRGRRRSVRLRSL